MKMMHVVTSRNVVPSAVDCAHAIVILTCRKWTDI